MIAVKIETSTEPASETVNAEFDDNEWEETEYEPQILVLVENGFARVEYRGDCEILVVDLDEIEVRGLDGVPPEADRWLTDFGELEGAIEGALLKHTSGELEPLESELGGEG
jgi:hypothetical protein